MPSSEKQVGFAPENHIVVDRITLLVSSETRIDSYAQGIADYTIHDPPLTDEGFAQSGRLGQYLQSPSFPKIELVVVSPMQRTLQTTDRALGWLRLEGVPFIALAQWQETSVNRIDIGRPLSQVAAQFPWCDFSHMDPVWPAKKGLYEFSQAALEARGVAAKRWLRARPEKVIAVVSHAGFMRTGICNRNFGNADFRVFEFGGMDIEKGDGVNEDTKLQLVESDLTARNGGGMGNSEDGFFGWQTSDFKWMPENNPKVKEELERTGYGAELHGTKVYSKEV